MSHKQIITVCNIDEEARFGGPEKRIIQVAAALNNMGASTHVVLPRMDADFFVRQIDCFNVRRTQFDLTRLSKEPYVLFRYCIWFWVEVFMLYRFLRGNKFDVVHVNGSYQIKGAIAAFISKTPVVWHLNDTMMHPVVKSIFYFVANKAATGFIVAGGRVYDYYIKGTALAHRPCQEIHAPVDVNIFRPSTRDLLHQMNCIRVVTVSGLNPTKGLKSFIEVAIRLHVIFPSLEFYIAGAEIRSHAEYADSLKDIIRTANIRPGVINFLGLVEDVHLLLNSADICVFTSISEASPTSIWEALSSGVPVVTTDVGSVNQYIENGASGFVVPVEDTDSLYLHIVKLINNSELRRLFGKNGRQVAVRYLDVTAAASKHIEIYRNVLSLNK